MKTSKSNPGIDLTRRLLLAASGSFLMPRWSWTESYEGPAFWWKLQEYGDSVRESIGATEGVIASRTGHAIWVGEGRNRALRLDGYSVWFRNNTSPATLTGDAVTIAAWVALESYPVNEAALLELQCGSNRVLRFSIDKWGFLQFGLHVDDAKSRIRSSAPIVRGKWVHLAVSAGSAGAYLYQDGVICGHLAHPIQLFKLGPKITFVLGGSPDCPVMDRVFPSGMLNCLLRDVRVYNGERSSEAIRAIMNDSPPDAPADLQTNGLWCIGDPHRPVCHSQPPRAWTNEPHGLIHWGGQYHIFYQKNPNGPYWSHLNWGHMTSPDMLRWTEMPVAISPEPGLDSEGCWSGNVLNYDGKLTLIYTAVDGEKASVCLANSEDGINFIKYDGNPVIAKQPSELLYQDFRDPFVWRENETYYLLIGSGMRDGGGTAFLFSSKNLLTWKYRKQIMSGDSANSGTFWELPLLLKIGDQHVLIVSEVPGRSSYWVGTWKDETFNPVRTQPQRLELFNHLLAPTPLMERGGRIVVMGIIPDERPPEELWTAGWAHLYSLPRVLSINDQGCLVQRPHECVKRLFCPLAAPRNFAIQGPTVYKLPNVAEASVHLNVTFLRGSSRSVSLLLRCSPNSQEQTEVLYDWERSVLVFDRTLSSLNTKVKRDREEVAYGSAEKDVLRLEVFLDRSVLEVFVDDRATFAGRIYPMLDTSNGVGFASSGGVASVEDLQVACLELPS